MPFKKPINGNNIQLTIDLEYQSILEEELFKRQLETDASSATGIILNPQNGEILAIASRLDLIIIHSISTTQATIELKPLQINLNRDQHIKLYLQFLLYTTIKSTQIRNSIVKMVSTNIILSQ